MVIARLDALHNLLENHFAEDKATERRVTRLEIQQAKQSVYVSLAGGLIGIIGSKMLGFVWR